MWYVEFSVLCDRLRYPNQELDGGINTYPILEGYNNIQEEDSGGAII